MNPDALSSMPTSAARVYGVALIVGPLLLLASTIAYITQGEGINEGVLGGTIGVWSVFALLIAFIGISRLLESSSPRAAATLIVVAAIGFSAGVAFNIEAALIGMAPEIDPILDDAFEEGSNAIAILAFIPWGWFAPLSFVFTGIMFWRTRLVARWSAALLIAGGVLFVIGRPARIDVLAVLTDVLLIAALVPIGWAVLIGARATTTAPASAVETASP